MLRILSLLICLYSGITMSNAIIAYPKKISIETITGEQVNITLKGDEYCKWAITEDNYVLLPDSLGWVYAKEDRDGYAVPSSFRLSVEKNYTKELKDFLSKQNKKIKPKQQTPDTEPVLKAIGKTSVTGTRKALVILMSFKDLEFTKNRQDFEALFNQAGYSVDGAMGSVRDYFIEVSYGQLNFTCDILGPYKAQNNMDYYGGNSVQGRDKNPMGLFREAVQFASKEINLTDYDANQDGYVDNIHLIFAGYGEEAGAPASAIWSHEATFPEIVIQEARINSYSCAPELRGNKGNGISRIGPHCHEMGHALGAMDYYDTDYETNGNFEGTGQWDIMASGSWNDDGVIPAGFNPYVKIYDFGWTVPQFVSPGDYVSLQPSLLFKDQIYRIDTPVDGEYFLLENRQRTGFDKALPGEGLLIYHIHKDIEHSFQGNNINTTHPQKCYIIAASSDKSVPNASPSSYGNINSAGCPFPGSLTKTSFNDKTIPSANCWNGLASNVNLSQISLHEDQTITFYSGMEEEKKVAWSYGFEGENPLFSWEILQVEGNVQWQHEMIDKANFPILKDELTPYAAEGKGYVSMKAKALSSAVVNSSLLILPELPLDGINNTYELSFQYQNRDYFSKKGKLSVVYRTESSDEWFSIAEYSDLSSDWILKKILLPDIPKEYQLALKGELSAGGICVDDLQLLKKEKGQSNVSGIKNSDWNIYYDQHEKAICFYSDKPDIVVVYNVFGRKLMEQRLIYGTNYLRLSSGIYIICINNERIKFIVK